MPTSSEFDPNDHPGKHLPPESHSDRSMPTVGDERVHLRIWHSAADRESRGNYEERCEALLPPEEISAADRFRLATSRNQHIVGRAMARRLLGDPHVAPSQIRFTLGDHGKPEVAEPPQAQQPFNIAHTHGLVLCGVANQNVELVGVDVEAVDRRTSTELAERYFARPEVEFLRTRPIGEQKRQFLRIWTLKESFIKAIGTGLHTPLSDFAFEGIETDRPQIRFLSRELDDGRTWKFVCFEPREGFIASAALVVKRTELPVTIDWCPFEKLLEAE